MLTFYRPTKETMAETTWKLIEDLGALTTTPQTADTIARAAGLVSSAGRVTGTGRREVRDALRGRDGVQVTTETRRGQVTILYARTEVQP